VVSKTAKPVMCPPGWLSRGTMPLATGSPKLAKTIGIVCVCRWMATVAVGERVLDVLQSAHEAAGHKTSVRV
jgi:hypothetical protein